MKAYLLTLILICAAGGAILTLLKDRGSAKYVRYLLCLSALLFLLGPLASLLKKQPQISFGSFAPDGSAFDLSDYAETLEKEWRDALAKQISKDVKTLEGLEDGDFEVGVLTEREGELFTLKKIVCVLKTARAVVLREAIRNTLLKYCEKVSFEEVFGASP